MLWLEVHLGLLMHLQSRPLPLLLGALSLATQPQGTNQSRPLPQLLGALSLATQPQGTTQVCTPKYVTIVIVLEGIHRACTHAIVLSPCARNATISHLSNSKLLLVLALLLLLLLPLSQPACHMPLLPQGAYHRA